jgi:osmotically-inducible protein OsmY
MKPQPPKSYDEITRRTVVEPDGSFRVDIGTPPELPSDQVLRASVADALLADGFTEVGIEVEHGRVTLRGWVRDGDTAALILRVAAQAAPGAQLDNRMHVGHG